MALALVALLLAGCTTERSPTADPIEGQGTGVAPTFAPTSGPAPTFAPPDAEPVPSSTGLGPRIDLLVVAPESDPSGYERDLFGGGWMDLDGDGCDTRCEVLARDFRPRLPGLPAGGWVSVHDGYSTPDASELDVDHTVPLAEAWRSGAHAWDPARRIAFANDTTHVGSLQVATPATNRSKRDRDPARWMPPDTSSWCAYAAAWIDTKVRWELAADPAELDALRNVVAARRC